MPEVHDASSDDRGILYLDHATGKLVIRASALGGCLTAFRHALAGEDATAPPARMQEVFSAGHVAEDEVKGVLRGFGYMIHHEQEEVDVEVCEYKGRTVVVRCHFDGLVDQLFFDKKKVLEVKSVNPDTFASWDPGWLAKGSGKPLWGDKYLWQFSTYMLASGLEMLLCITERGNPEHFTNYVIEKAPYTFEDIRERVMMILDEGYALPECKGEWACPYSYICYKKADNDDELFADRLPDYVEYELKELARTYVDMKAREKEVATAVKILRDQITSLLDANHRDVVNVGSHIVKRSTSTVKEHVVKESTRTTLTVKEA